MNDSEKVAIAFQPVTIAGKQYFPTMRLRWLRRPDAFGDQLQQVHFTDDGELAWVNVVTEVPNE